MNRVHERLWQGDVNDAVHHAAEFDVVILCAKELKPTDSKLAVSVDVSNGRWFPFDDSEHPTEDDRVTADAAIRFAHAQWARGKRLLITCAMGWNRSGLVVGGVLRRIGYPAEAAVQAVKAARGRRALSNPKFRQWLGARA